MAACLYGIHSQKVLRAASHFSVSINSSCCCTRRLVSPPIVHYSFARSGLNCNSAENEVRRFKKDSCH
ncbi:hypothetical protein Peur_012580 [Populus x canadensis]